jgi:hypothetical protein
MRILKRGIIGVASAAVIATGAIAAFAANGTQPAPQPTTSVGIKGPCDEAEHANDPHCHGAQVPEEQSGGDDRNHDNGGANEAEPNDDNGGLIKANDDGPNRDAGDDHGGLSGGHSGPSDSSGSGSRGEEHSGSDDNSGPGSSNSGSGSSGGDNETS